MERPIIAPSMLASDFANIQREVEMINQSDADWIHLDIMDGTFVPNISFGLPVVEAVKRHASKPLDVHLMIQHPENYIEAFHRAGATAISVHYEAATHLHRTLHQIKELGCLAGVALNPHTNIQCIEDVINDIDFVLIMSVNPGYGGQKFIPRTYDKIRQLKELIISHGAATMIEIDGGVSEQNASSLIEAGADILVAGSTIFNSHDPKHTISELKNVKVPG